MTIVHAHIESPCIRKCCLNEKDMCLGCFRTLSEITQWTQVEDTVRQQILHNASHRQKAYQQQLLHFAHPQ
ncbi:MAG: DUF1289 domain-containing protein [Methylovulum sp.]|uniref:DUF1289 domain-containing protein n=1 Tax=Methylovulum sp. TaxID=1916980 RepID=UPI002609067E|nr:DUF1289 domain-containing protein [Methylovulum sp.]MDD2725482.1 DUF1289 domain-containing protein [Methylovulum sp.]MDD5125670.1 DUF1289 domain-containing protein [Methylovulum sp.]